ncbi:MAG TPA: protein kinase [Burkholderiales bacterium]|nr:protein kinase [Burkholderiales bacterium]
MSEQAYPDALQPQYRMHWYTIERVLGQGGFGITYLARDTNLDQLVAIKEYLPVEVATRRPDSTVRSRSEGQRERYRWGLDRFIQEARTLARFDHPNIVRVHSVFEFNGTAYMVMRFEEGDNLASLLDRRGTLPERDLLRILLPILDGLELVHNAGFIHRDIKPDNIHIRSDGSPVLLDFGSARHALGKAHTLTILVAPGYAPFEQYHSSSENQGPWTDIYGLGATCYRAIAGTQPMDAITRSKGILGSTREVLVPARTVGSGRYSAHLLAAVDHALEFAEKNRPQNVAEWRREILGESSAAGAAPAVPDKSAVAASQWASPPASTPVAGPSAPPAVPPQAAHGTPPRADVPTARRGWSGARAPIAWSIAGAAAAAIAIGVFLWPPVDRDPEEKIRQIQKELDRTKELLKESETDAKTRQKLLALLAEQEEAKRRQEEEARKRREEQEKQAAAKLRDEEEARKRLEEKQRLAAARLRQEEETRKRLEEKRLAEARLRKEEEARKRLEEQQRAAEAARRAEEERLALAEPSGTAPPGNRSAQAEQLARGEGALARREYERAKEILTPLAEEGNSRAQIRLAEMYAFGQGVKQNTIQSYIWYSLAAYGGNTSAATGRDRMAARLQPAEIKQADRVVESMRPR